MNKSVKTIVIVLIVIAIIIISYFIINKPIKFKDNENIKILYSLDIDYNTYINVLNEEGKKTKYICGKEDITKFLDVLSNVKLNPNTTFFSPILGGAYYYNFIDDNLTVNVIINDDSISINDKVYKTNINVKPLIDNLDIIYNYQ